MIAYKFTHKKFAELLIRGECVKIGSLSYYRSTESHNIGKVDPDENKVNVATKKINISFHPPPVMLSQLAKIGVKISPFSKITPHKEVIIKLSGRDAYIFCTSLTDSYAAAHRIDPTYDACVQIGNVRQFAINVTQGIRDLGVMVGNTESNPIQYRDRKVDIEDEWVFSPFLKGTQFAEDKEYRFVWSADMDKLEPSLLVRFDPLNCDLKMVW